MDLLNADPAPLLRMALLGATLALGPLSWLWLRHRHATPQARVRALTLLTLFLTFDLIVFGAFTRLSDSGLGCPDWPGCYGSASPIGAHAEIASAQSAIPTGAVTHTKAWIEMLHRYLATTVGVLITVLAVHSVLAARRGTAVISARWSVLTFFWVCMQGAFGAWTVTLKLYPAIVTLHLLGGIGLLALLAVQARLLRPQPVVRGAAPSAALVAAVLGLVVLQVMLGGWVSSNYAVLACSDFPTCQGAWLPPMDLEHGFAIFRPLGGDGRGGFLPFQALTAIHMVHRLGAVVAIAALGVLVVRLLRSGDGPQRHWALGLIAAVVWQLASGLGNVVLGWPIAAALAHSAGAAALVGMLAALWVDAHRARLAGKGAAAPADAPRSGPGRRTPATGRAAT